MTFQRIVQLRKFLPGRWRLQVILAENMLVIQNDPVRKVAGSAIIMSVILKSFGDILVHPIILNPSLHLRGQISDRSRFGKVAVNGFSHHAFGWLAVVIGHVKVLLLGHSPTMSMGIIST